MGSDRHRSFTDRASAKNDESESVSYSSVLWCPGAQVPWAQSTYVFSQQLFSNPVPDQLTGPTQVDSALFFQAPDAEIHSERTSVWLRQ